VIFAGLGRTTHFFGWRCSRGRVSSDRTQALGVFNLVVILKLPSGCCVREGFVVCVLMSLITLKLTTNVGLNLFSDELKWVFISFLGFWHDRVCNFVFRARGILGCGLGGRLVQVEYIV